jgi:hypothetical protein
MAGVIVVLAIVVFLAGLAVGVVAALTIVVRREGGDYALSRSEVLDRLALGARRLGGAGRGNLRH